MKIKISRIALLCSSVVLALAVGELTLWALGRSSHGTDRRALHEPRPDRPWLYGLKPGASGTLPGSGVVYRVNADGFRDHRYRRPKPEEVFRILVLGDSVAFGYGVEMAETFPKQLEDRLAAVGEIDKSVPVEVLNLAVGGYNPYNEAALLEDLAASYQPDLVLVQFCINDLNDPTAHFDVQTRLHLGTIPDAAYPDPSARRAPPEPPGIALRLCRRSRLCSLVDDAVLAANELVPQEQDQPSMMAPVEDDDGPEWPWLENIYRRMAESSRSLGAGFAVVAFPYRAQIDGTEAHPVERRLVAMGDRNGWHTVEALARFRRAARNGQSLFIDWWHPTPLGHRLAARETVRQLACAGLLTEEVNSLCRRGSQPREPGER